MELMILFIASRYGASIDEPVQQRYGEKTFQYYASLGKNTESLSYRNLYLYGPAFEMLVVAIQKTFHWIDPYTIRHSIQGLTGLLGGIVLFNLLLLVNIPRLYSFFGSLLLILNPYWLGHSFINSKDIPFATFFLFSIYSFFKFL